MYYQLTAFVDEVRACEALPQEQRVPFVLPGPQLRVVARPDILAVTR